MKTTDYWNMIYNFAEGVVYGMTQNEINETTYHDVFELCNIHEVSTEYADDIYRVICNEWKN